MDDFEKFNEASVTYRKCLIIDKKYVFTLVDSIHKKVFCILHFNYNK
jgi:hypothetical protein